MTELPVKRIKSKMHFFTWRCKNNLPVRPVGKTIHIINCGTCIAIKNSESG
jgi:hypothetical protein